MQDGIRMEVAHLYRPVRDPSEVGCQLVSTDSLTGDGHDVKSRSLSDLLSLKVPNTYSPQSSSAQVGGADREGCGGRMVCMSFFCVGGRCERALLKPVVEAV